MGGGKIFADQKVVVTQPTSGDFKAFSAVCTHQGCVVSGVADGTINCACHGSEFDIATGAVKQGPATKAAPREDGHRERRRDHRHLTVGPAAAQGEVCRVVTTRHTSAPAGRLRPAVGDPP